MVVQTVVCIFTSKVESCGLEPTLQRITTQNVPQADNTHVISVLAILATFSWDNLGTTVGSWCE